MSTWQVYWETLTLGVPSSGVPIQCGLKYLVFCSGVLLLVYTRQNKLLLDYTTLCMRTPFYRYDETQYGHGPVKDLNGNSKQGT